MKLLLFFSLLVVAMAGKKKMCQKFCTKMYEPVCGSDGETYPNECVLEVASCKSSDKIIVAHEGVCEKKKVCPMICPLNYRPVCGSDGKTYSNLCALQVVACQTDKEITVDHQGKCEDQEKKKNCQKACILIYKPVCGSDGKTYPSKCNLEVASCESNGKITLAHEGKCDCNKVCNHMYTPVCGSDGKTYPNKCVLEMASCKSNGKISVANEGNCDKEFLNIQDETCVEKRERLLQVIGHAMIGQFVPECDLNGSYKKVQCWGSIGYCWCVDRVTGEKDDETMTRGTPEC